MQSSYMNVSMQTSTSTQKSWSVRLGLLRDQTDRVILVLADSSGVFDVSSAALASSSREVAAARAAALAAAGSAAFIAVEMTAVAPSLLVSVIVGSAFVAFVTVVLMGMIVKMLFG